MVDSSMMPELGNLVDHRYITFPYNYLINSSLMLEFKFILFGKFEEKDKKRKDGTF